MSAPCHDGDRYGCIGICGATAHRDIDWRLCPSLAPIRGGEKATEEVELVVEVAESVEFSELFVER